MVAFLSTHFKYFRSISNHVCQGICLQTSEQHLNSLDKLLLPCLSSLSQTYRPFKWSCSLTKSDRLCRRTWICTKEHQINSLTAEWTKCSDGRNKSFLSPLHSFTKIQWNSFVYSKRPHYQRQCVTFTLLNFELKPMQISNSKTM